MSMYEGWTAKCAAKVRQEIIYSLPELSSHNYYNKNNFHVGTHLTEKIKKTNGRYVIWTDSPKTGEQRIGLQLREMDLRKYSNNIYIEKKDNQHLGRVILAVEHLMEQFH